MRRAAVSRPHAGFELGSQLRARDLSPRFFAILSARVVERVQR
jgi:hypothetical protein